MTHEQLLRFIDIRNQSGFASNLQFASDASEAGFDVRELGTPVKLDDGGYAWSTPHGRLVEQCGKLELNR